MNSIILVSGKPVSVSASLVIKVQNMLDFGKSVSEIATETRKGRAFTRALVDSINEHTQMKCAG